MHLVLRRFVDGLREGHDVETFRAVFADAIGAFDLGTFAYVELIERPAKAPFLISTYPKTWTDHYFRQKYEDVDPVISGARNGVEPFHWGRDFASGRLSRQQQTLFDEASEFGILGGVTIPIHEGPSRFAAVTLASDQHSMAFHRLVDRDLKTLQLMAIALHAAILRISTGDRLIDGVLLTEREYECLQWAALGKSAWEIGRIVGIARRTASFHLDNAKAKLGVRSVCQAVARLAAARSRDN